MEGCIIMDILVEQVVKKNKNSKYWLNIFLIIFGAILIPVGLTILSLILKKAYVFYIALFAALFCVYGAWMLVTGQNIEYEYATLSGTFRADKIIAKRNRKNIVKIDIKTIDDMFKYSDKEMASRKFNKVYYAGAQEYSDENYVVTFVSEAKGKCALVFSPKEKILEGMRPYLRHDIVRKMFL